MTNPSLRGPVPKEMRCIASILNGGPWDHGCSRKGHFLYNKKRYCRQHFPPHVEERKLKSYKILDIKFKQMKHGRKLERLLFKIGYTALRIPFDQAILQRAIHAYRKAEKQYG